MKIILFKKMESPEVLARTSDFAKVESGQGRSIVTHDKGIAKYGTRKIIISDGQISKTEQNLEEYL